MSTEVKKIIRSLRIKEEQNPEYYEFVANAIAELLEHGWDEEDFEGTTVKEILREYEDLTDISWATPNEKYEDFVEHENFD